MTDAPDPDYDLLMRFAAGDRGALEELANAHERALLGLARGLMGGDSGAACDAVQSMWLRVIRYAGTFKGRSKVKTWLYRILVNECRVQRRHGRRKPAPLRLAGEGAAPRHCAALHEALASLPDERREVLLLCYHAGVTHTIAAEILEIPLGTLKSRLHAGLRELRCTLDPDEEGVA
jgi:RNA polymerase sigma-70 factor (ECF subfamily)